MPQQNRRRSNRLRQLQIGSNDGMVSNAQNSNSHNDSRNSVSSSNRNRSNRNRIHRNSLTIDHPPPFTLRELKKKTRDALKLMTRAYGIIEGHRWRKADYVKALYDHGQLPQYNQQQQHESIQPIANESDPGMLCALSQ